MNKKIKKFVITCVVLLALIALITLIALYDVNFGVIKIVSIKTLLSQYNQVTTANTNLEQQSSTYNSTLKSLDTAKESYKTQKAKYDSISDETLKIIKEANTSQKYDIEYIWVKLGNYAKENNLSIVLVEPGGTSSAKSTSTTSQTGSNTSNPSTTTSGSSTSSSSSQTTQSNVSGTKSSDTTKSTVSSQQADASANASSNLSSSANSTDSKNTTSDALATTSSPDNSGALSIQVTGNYINVSDFIFELENDKELNFKLDNISMEYVGNNNIKATFSVKNMVVIK